MSLSVQGRTAIVTGAARGLGLAIARHLAEAGANVMFADSDEAALDAELGEQVKSDGPIRAFAGDLGQKLTLANLVSATIDAFDRIDILVNAHRAVQPCDPLAVSDELMGDMMRENMTAGLKLSQMVARRMVAQADEGDTSIQIGAIVNLTSLVADRPHPQMLAYSIASAAQAQATRSLAMALAPKRIRVNGIAFGSIMSNQLQMNLREDPGLRERLIAVTPLGRIASADELGPVVQFLASEGAAFITGQILRVDGGRSLGDPMGPGAF